MRTVIVRYMVKPDRVAENEQLVRDVYEELHRTPPAGFHYATFQLGDGVSFLHLAAMEEGENPLAQVEAFGRFQEDIAGRCDEAPVVTEVREIGAFQVFAP